MDRLTLPRDAAAALLATVISGLVACAGPGQADRPAASVAPAPGVRPAVQVGETAQGPAKTYDPAEWGTVVFRVTWPDPDRQVAFIPTDTNLIAIAGFTSAGATLKNYAGDIVVGALDKVTTKLVFAEIPAGDVRFDATASNALIALATGSVSFKVAGNTTTQAKLVLGVPGTPVIDSFSPGSGIPDETTITVKGKNFDTIVPGFAVVQSLLIGVTPVTVNRLTDQTITFELPAGASNGQLKFTWTAEGASDFGTSAAFLKVIKSLTIDGSPNVQISKGGTQAFTATVVDALDNSVGSSEYPTDFWAIPAQACVATGSSCLVGSLNAGTGVFTSLAAGTATLSAGAGAVGSPTFKTVAITVTDP